MKCQILFSGKNKKNISKCRLLKILPRVLSVNRETALKRPVELKKKKKKKYKKLLGEWEAVGSGGFFLTSLTSTKITLNSDA